MSRQKEIENAIKTFIYFDHSLDEKSLLLGMNWSDEFPEFKREEFIEKINKIKEKGRRFEITARGTPAKQNIGNKECQIQYSIRQDGCQQQK